MPEGRIYGLIGKSLKHSFSANYFNNKFKSQASNDQYTNIEIDRIEDFQITINGEKSYSGLNVTFPYKESIIPFLSCLSKSAEEIGAVNTIAFVKGQMIGHNTDSAAFSESLKSLFVGRAISEALILGSGGAAKAVEYAIKSLNIKYKIVSRIAHEEEKFLEYKDLESHDISSYQIIINCTPLGTYPDSDSKPDIPYHQLKADQLLYDLVYNPELSSFLKEGQKRGLKIKNGKEMLLNQAELSWSIWNQKE